MLRPSRTSKRPVQPRDTAACGSLLAACQQQPWRPPALPVAPSRQHLLATMTTINTAAAALQFVLLPATGALSDAFGREPVMLARAAASTVFPLLMAAARATRCSRSSASRPS